MKVYAKIICENRRPCKSTNDKGETLYPIKLRITYQRYHRFFNIDIPHLTLEEWEKIESGKRLNNYLVDVKTKIIKGIAKADKILNEMDIFSFNEFKRIYFGENKIKKKYFLGVFSTYINDLKDQGRIGTANSYLCAFNSIKSFQKNIQWNDITVGFLEDYESFMKQKGRSQNTIGIYLRSLKAIINQGISKGYFAQSDYPFGKQSHARYQIPSSVNTKKALTKEEIDLIKNLEAPAGSRMRKAKDFWLFSYYINGLNVKDIVNLKWENIDYKDEMIRFIRKKTERANKGHQVKITAALNPFVKEVIDIYGNLDRSLDNYVFGVINKGDSPEQIHSKTHDFTKSINIGLKQICTHLNLDKTITTYSARHSHATILLQNGASLEQIMDQFKHSSMKVTMNYIDSITDQSKKDLSKML